MMFYVSVASSRDDRDVVERYLYEGNRIVATATGDRFCGFIVETPTAFKAAYQADRLASGLFAAGVFETYQDAVENLYRVFDLVAVQERDPLAD